MGKHCEGADFPLCGKSHDRKALPVTPQSWEKHVAVPRAQY